MQQLEVMVNKKPFKGMRKAVMEARPMLLIGAMGIMSEKDSIHIKDLYQCQINGGRYYLHETNGAIHRDKDWISNELAKEFEEHFTTTSIQDQGATRWVTNSGCVAEAVHRNGDVHRQGNRGQRVSRKNSS